MSGDQPVRTPTPYVELDRDAWARLRLNTPLPLTAEELDRLAGRRTGLRFVAEVKAGAAQVRAPVYSHVAASTVPPRDHGILQSCPQRLRL